MILPNESKPDRLNLTWQGVERLIDELCSKILRFRFDRLIAVARGGLVPASMLAHRLSFRRVESVQVVSYDDDETATQPTILNPAPYLTNPRSRTLFVDDIIDSGRTIQTLNSAYPGSTFAALVAKTIIPFGITTVIGERVSQSTWVVFPWEKK